ncbi:unnamed protein product, partial [Prorocentrum cordatum]
AAQTLKQLLLGEPASAEPTGPEAAVVPEVTLFSKPACPLCDKAEAVLRECGLAYDLRVVNIDAPGNEEWRARYWCDIPVFHVSGEYWAKHRLEPADVRSALAEAAGGAFRPRAGRPDASDFPPPEDGEEGDCGGDCGPGCCDDGGP